MAMSPEKNGSTDSELFQHYEETSGHGKDLDNLNALGYKEELRRNRSMFTLLFQSLAIAAVSSLCRRTSFATLCAQLVQS